MFLLFILILSLWIFVGIVDSYRIAETANENYASLGNPADLGDLIFHTGKSILLSTFIIILWIMECLRTLIQPREEEPKPLEQR